MSKYKVLSPLKHDGKFCNPGDQVELSGEVAKYLVDHGTVKKVADPPKKKADSSKKKADSPKK